MYQAHHHLTSPRLNFGSHEILSKNVFIINKIKDILSQQTYFNLIHPDDQKIILDSIKIKTYFQNQEIAHQNSDFNYIFIILNGSVKVKWTTDDNKTITETFLKKEEIYNIIPIITNKKLIYNYISHEKTQIAIMPGDIFREVLKRNYEATFHILELVSERFTHVLQKNYHRNNASLKVNLAIEIIKIIENHRMNNDDFKNLPIKINQENLAELLNTTRQKINKELNWFSQESIFSARYNKIEILDYEKLVAISKQEFIE